MEECYLARDHQIRGGITHHELTPPTQPVIKKGTISFARRQISWRRFLKFLSPSDPSSCQVDTKQPKSSPRCSAYSQNLGFPQFSPLPQNYQSVSLAVAPSPDQNLEIAGKD